MASTTRSIVLRAVPLAALAAFSLSCSRMPPGTFKEPAEAVQAVHDLVGSGDVKKVEAIFGPGSMDMFQTGDDVADQADYARIKGLIEEKVGFEDVDDTTKVALLGKAEWPFPVPLVKEGEAWRFDSVKGREEIANRTVGRNELLTMATLRAVVDAQREYAQVGRDGLPPQYARRFRSTEGKQDGLYWATAEGEPESPLGPLAAMAAAKGYETGAPAEGEEPQPFNGYLFRLLESQGKSAPGGARAYVDAAGNLTGGYAILAWPVKYGASGIMTFMVSDRGLIFEKDLGEGTEAAVAAIQEFNPDETWEPTWDPDDVPETTETAAAEEAPAAPAAPAASAPGGTNG